MTDNQRLCLVHLLNYSVTSIYIISGMFALWHIPLIFLSVFLVLNIGVICGYHRYFTHSCFKTSRFNKILMLYLGTIASIGAVIGWVAVHRKHHRYSDTENDPHSPAYKGMLKVWFGYFFNIYRVEGKYGAKLARDKDIMFFQKYYYAIIILTVILLGILNPVLIIVLYSIPQIVALNATSAINVLTHKTGQVEDSPVLGVLIFGEGWHKQHHQSPLEIQLDKYDIAGLTIKHMLETKNGH